MERENDALRGRGSEEVAQVRKRHAEEMDAARERRDARETMQALLRRRSWRSIKAV